MAPELISYTDQPLAHPPDTWSCFKEISILFHMRRTLPQVREPELALHWSPEKSTTHF